MDAIEPKRETVTEEIPNIVAVRPAAGRCVVVTWRAGGENLIDLSEHIARFEIFAPLRSNDELFGTVAVGEWGWSIGWSEDMEISSDTLWRLALEQGAAWLRTWRRDHRLTQISAARALGISPRMWRYYEAASHLLPKTVQLAAMGLDAPSASLAIRNVIVAGHRTSVRLEPVMWDGLRDIARHRGITIHELMTEIAEHRQEPSLTAAIRVYLVGYYRREMTGGAATTATASFVD